MKGHVIMQKYTKYMKNRMTFFFDEKICINLLLKFPTKQLY